MESELVDDALVERIVTTTRTAIGDSLRSVTYFTRSDFDQLYLRSDLARDADLDTFVGHEWRGYRDTQMAYGSSELGAYEFTVRAFENGYLLRVATERCGVLITTDGLSIQRCEEIANTLKEILERSDDGSTIEER